MRLYDRNTGEDVWRDVEPDEELQHELSQLLANRDKIQKMLENCNRNIRLKEEEILIENKRRGMIR